MIQALPFVNNVTFLVKLVLAHSPINAFYVPLAIKEQWLIRCVLVMMGTTIMVLVYVLCAIPCAKNALIHRSIIVLCVLMVTTST